MYYIAQHPVERHILRNLISFRRQPKLVKCSLGEDLMRLERHRVACSPLSFLKDKGLFGKGFREINGSQPPLTSGLKVHDQNGTSSNRSWHFSALLWAAWIETMGCVDRAVLAHSGRRKLLRADDLASRSGAFGPEPVQPLNRLLPRQRHNLFACEPDPLHQQRSDFGR